MGRLSLDQQRNGMVDTQIVARGIRDPRVLAAMRDVPRHLFVPEKFRARAYEDHPVPIGCGQTISQPYIVAIMTELLAVTPGDHILEIGAGSGYQAAILARLAASVVSVERHEVLAEQAQACLEELGCTNATVVCGDGSLGYPEAAPYDAIIVTAACPHVPPALKEQLCPGGRLVCPTGSRDLQQLLSIVREEDGFVTTQSIRCVFVPLIGAQGWPSGEA